MAEVLTFRCDSAVEVALRELTADGTDRSTAIRRAIIAAAGSRAREELAAQARMVAADPDDQAEAARVLADMAALRAW